MNPRAVERTILITGVSGQVGYELARTLQGLARVVAVDRSVLDLSNLDQIRSVVRDTRPTLIVNPAAYTAVDKAESEAELAMRINAEAPGVLAEEAKRLGAALVHYSTDYVFDGTKDSAYVETDATNPQNEYGKSKLAGEQAIQASGCAHLILRTSWVYGMRGKNFLLTMLRLGAERPELKIVADQFGAPTWSNTIATLTAHIVAQSIALDDSADWWHGRTGVYHLTAGDSTSWHGFASAIFDQARLENPPRLLPIPASDYPTPATRPANSRMSNDKLAQVFGLRAPRWEDALRLCMEAR
ncbi:dTDP-4-dehydrorhamnose reductase [Paraburkholderia diazotrophica]|uniref:dTDP-4-dehydrorhamnose reductase n=1 Tax=Paraburkholderia diazotrophica TaxID=667676 RepID=A0A1H7DR16_9BURK|nr:dTDP-4-dehydrorhamnose reductase [Paraburkholderia diazotrophica]SEK02102.1 dTDP-4-dehydrorhamnose reductase [Paraburkholderia diazotrophica]